MKLLLIQMLSMIRISIRRMLHSPLRFFSLIAVLTITSALLSALPIFNRAATQYWFGSELNRYETEERRPAGLIKLWLFQEKSDFESSSLHKFRENLEQQVENEIPLPLDRILEIGVFSRFFYNGESFGRIGFNNFPEGSFSYVSGRPPESSKGDGEPLEAAVSEQTLKDLNLSVGRIYKYKPFKDRERKSEEIQIKVTGSFIFTDDLAGYTGADESILWISENSFTDRYRTGWPLQWMNWTISTDSSGFDFAKAAPYYRGLIRLYRFASSHLPGLEIKSTPLHIVYDFLKKSKELNKLLIALIVPALSMLFIFLFLTVKQIFLSRVSNISVYKSRGAGKRQIILMYFFEWIPIAGGASLLAPFVGMGFAGLLVSSRGFLSFVNRPDINYSFMRESFLWPLVAVALSFLVWMLPAALYSGLTITGSRNKKDASKRFSLIPFLMEAFVLVLALLSFYFLKSGTFQSGDKGYLSNPGLYLLPVLFILSLLALLFRCMPYLAALTGKLTAGRGGLNHFLFIRFYSRTPGSYTPVLFLTSISVALGLFTAGLARNTDLNLIESVYRENGSDLVLNEKWIDYSTGSGSSGDLSLEADSIREPAFYKHSSLPSVISAAKILELEDARFQGVQDLTVGIQAFDPLEFYNTARFDDRRFPYYLEDVLNSLITYENGFFMDSDTAASLGLAPGEFYRFTLDKIPFELMFLGEVDHWPSISLQSERYIIGNFNYINGFLYRKPYNVWLKTGEAAKTEEIITALEQEGIYLNSLKDSRQTIFEESRDPGRMGIYGILSFSFILSLFVSLTGILQFSTIRWENRKYNIGTLRAIGISKSGALRLILTEQVFMAMSALISGIITGSAALKLYMPVLQPGNHLIARLSGERITVIVMTLSVFLLTMIIIRYRSRKMNIGQAIRMGGDEY